MWFESLAIGVYLALVEDGCVDNRKRIAIRKVNGWLVRRDVLHLCACLSLCFFVLSFALVPCGPCEVLRRISSKWHMGPLALDDVPLVAIVAVEPIPHLLRKPRVTSFCVLQTKPICGRIVLQAVGRFFGK